MVKLTVLTNNLRKLSAYTALDVLMSRGFVQYRNITRTVRENFTENLHGHCKHYYIVDFPLRTFDQNSLKRKDTVG